MSLLALANFQRTLVDAIADELAQPRPAACVLLAPTGSGKTLMLGRALSAAASRGLMPPTVWLWVAPQDVVVEQTLDTLLEQAGPSAFPRSLARNRSIAGHTKGDIWVSTTAYVTNPKSGLSDDTEKSVSLETFVLSLRAGGFRVGLVIDEAHIAAADVTRFGEVMRDIVRPDVVIAATATPKDARLNAFLTALGQTARRNFSVSRGDVVRERLNKSSLRALRLVSDKERDSIDSEGLHDLLVQRAWERNVAIRDALLRNGVDVEPLMLVQVGNGKAEGAAMKARVCRVAGLAEHEVALYLDGEKSHGSLADVARDPRVRVLVFKVAAGTGFDAPRAFVLASARSGEDEGAALQFIGRIMRVEKEVRSLLYGTTLTESDRTLLDTGRLVLLDDESQAGFRKAADLVKSIRSELDHLGEASGLDDDIEVEDERVFDPSAETDSETDPDVRLGAKIEIFELEPRRTPSPASGSADILVATPMASPASAILAPAIPAPAILAAAPVPLGPQQESYASIEALREEAQGQGIELYGLDDAIPVRFSQERWPDIVVSGDIITNMANAVPSDAALVLRLRGEVLGERKVHSKESDLLGSGRAVTETGLIEGSAFAGRLIRRQADAVFADLSTMTDKGSQRQLVEQIVRNVQRNASGMLPDGATLRTMALRLVVEARDALREEQQRSLISGAVSIAAADLPRLLAAPVGFGDPSPRSGYGFIPGRFQDLPGDSRKVLAKWARSVLVAGVPVEIAAVDNDWCVNETEREMIELLDIHPDVRWWLRNPARKPYGVSILKLDGKRGDFWPDFVLGTTLDDVARQQLAETKYDPNDLESKIRRGKTLDFGRVIFIRRFEGQLRIVRDDLSLGAALTRDTLADLGNRMREAFRA